MDFIDSPGVGEVDHAVQAHIAAQGGSRADR
jgi:hypothetical protein